MGSATSLSRWTTSIMYRPSRVSRVQGGKGWVVVRARMSKWGVGRRSGEIRLVGLGERNGNGLKPRVTRGRCFSQGLT